MNPELRRIRPELRRIRDRSRVVAEQCARYRRALAISEMKTADAFVRCVAGRHTLRLTLSAPAVVLWLSAPAVVLWPLP